MSDQIQAGINDMNLLTRDGQVVGHEVGIVAASRDEAVDLSAMIANQLQRLLLGRLRQRFEENVVPLERGQNGNLEPSLQLMHQAGKQDVGQIHNLRPDFRLQPIDQLGHLFGLVAMFAFEHGDRQIAEVFRSGLGGESPRPVEQSPRVKKSVDQTWRMPEKRNVLFQKHIDAAEEDSLLTYVRFVGMDRSVGWNEKC